MISDLARFEMTKIMKYDVQIESILCILNALGLFETASILAGFPKAEWTVEIDPKRISCRANASYGSVYYQYHFPLTNSVSNLALFEMTKIMMFEGQIEEKLCFLATMRLFETASILAGFPEAEWTVEIEPKWILCHANASYGRMHYQYRLPDGEE